MALVQRRPRLLNVRCVSEILSYSGTPAYVWATGIPET